jgi:hypothetical protein
MDELLRSVFPTNVHTITYSLPGPFDREHTEEAKRAGESFWVRLDLMNGDNVTLSAKPDEYAKLVGLFEDAGLGCRAS